MTIDVWMQHPTLRFLRSDMLASLRRWTGDAIPDTEIPIEATLASMDAAGVDVGLLCAWRGPTAKISSATTRSPTGFACTPTGLPVWRPSTWIDRWRQCASCVDAYVTTGSSDCGWCRGCGTPAHRSPVLSAVCRMCAAGGAVLHPGRPHRSAATVRDRPPDSLHRPGGAGLSELVIVCGHVGYPWTEEMVAVARKHENVYIDTSAYTTKRLPTNLSGS
ncbi:amidohydrolase family protein [Mycobacterium xenopi 3993]|nr:amidohydrolase family protein [Mycobacterium xenopi 3993]